jgi:hypothetical protein
MIFGPDIGINYSGSLAKPVEGVIHVIVKKKGATA